MRVPALSRAQFLIGLALVAGLAPPLLAQTVRVQVVADDPPRPVAGALLSLQTERGERVAQTLTNETGRATLQAPGPGTYRIRADRIGYSGTITDPFTVTAGVASTVTVAMPDTRVLLPELTVRSTRRVCRLARESGTALATVWDEARKALTGTQLTRTAFPPEMEITTFERDLDPADRITAERSTTARRHVTRPFVAPDPARLLEHGFLEERGSETWIAAPDAELLLSDPFLETHCFGVVGGVGADTGLVGLAFEPARGRRVPEIRGTLWLDRASAELRYLEFSYLNLDDRFSVGGAGGRLEFRRLATGAWIVSEWWIRTPLIGRTVARRLDGWPAERDSLLGRRETGGRAEVVSIEALAGRTVLTGTVYDSTAGAPLQDAVVSIGGGSYADTTDAGGRFRIETPTRGDFLVTAEHPAIALLAGATLTAAARLERGAVTTIDLAIPPLDRLASALCADVTVAGGGLAILTGFLRDSGGRPAPGASVTLRFRGIGTIPTTVTATADDRGRYRLCGLNRTARVWLADAGGLTPSPRSIDLAGRRLTLADIALAPGHPGTRASMLVRVRDSATGGAVEGALLVLQPEGDTARTGRAGIGRLPSGGVGLHRLIVHAPGYATAERDIEGEPVADTVVVSLSGILALASMADSARSVAGGSRLAGFRERRERGNGRFFTVEQLRPLERSPLSGLLRQVPGVRLVPRPGACGGYAAASGRPSGSGPGHRCQDAPFPLACYMTVYVDGTVFWREGSGEPPPDVDQFRVQDLEAIEAYGQAQLPAEFQTMGAACGGIILWRRL